MTTPKTRNDDIPRFSLSRAVLSLGESSRNVYGQALYDSLIQSLADSTRADCVFLATVDKAAARAETLSVCTAGKIAANFSYDLVSSPCRQVVDVDVCTYPRNVVSHFPDDQMLIDMGIEGYIGVPLRGHLGDTLGLVVLLSRAPIEDEQKLLTLLQLVSSMFSAELGRQASERLTLELLNTDAITGLASKHALTTYLEVAGRKTLLIAQIDNLPLINDAYGFAVGDVVMQRVAKRMARYEDAELIASIGPSKVAMVLPPTHDVAHTAADITEHCRQNPLSTDDVSVYLSATCAAATGEHELLQQATTALRRALAWGSFQHLKLDASEVNDLRQRQRELISRGNFVNESLKRQRVIPVFQQVVSVATNEPDFLESRARIFHDNELIRPDDFLEAAATSGTVSALTRVMIKRSLQIMASHGLPFMQSITSQDLDQGYLLEFLPEEMKRFDLPHERLTLGVRQEALTIKSERHIDQLRALKAQGFKVAIEKFGAGHYSFSSMLSIDLDYVKLDGTLVKRAFNDVRYRALMAAVVQLCKTTRVSVIAEHIDSAELHAFVKELDVDYYEGHWFSKPKVLSI